MEWVNARALCNVVNRFNFAFEIFQLSEMTADLAEEHSAAVLASERLEAEQADRMKLEKEKNDLQVRFANYRQEEMRRCVGKI